MRPFITAATPRLVCPSPEARAEAAATGGSREAHDRFMATWPCMSTVEVVQPSGPDGRGAEDIRIAAWNIERLKRVEASAERIAGLGADIVLATEVDRGMARSGQRDTIGAFAGALGMGHVFGVEFVELGIGDRVESVDFAGHANDCGLHGNAIVTRWPIRDAAVIPLEDGGAWFVGQPKNDGQHRVGGRIAVAARIETPCGPLTVAAAHYESESDRDGRARQTARLLSGLEALYGPGPAVIGGDLNTGGFEDAGLHGAEMLARPEVAEPLFRHVAEAGFDWRAANTGAVTGRYHPRKGRDFPLKTLDWLFTRDVQVRDPWVAEAICAAGDYLSDHEIIGATVAF